MATKQFKYKGLLFLQRKSGPKLVLFSAPAGELLAFSSTDELGPSNTGPQRELKSARVSSICKFLAVDEKNTIPSAVILAFAPGKTQFAAATSMLTVAVAKNTATIVDGQHRLHGVNQFDPKIEIPVVGLLETDSVERAFQFLVINNKASRVPAAHTKSLIAKMNGTKLPARLRGARLAFDSDGIGDVDIVNTDKESPFFHTIDWPTTPESKRMIQATAIQLSLDYIESLGMLGYEDRDVRRDAFLSAWKTIKATWSKYWNANSHLTEKVGVMCLTRFVFDMLSKWSDNDDLELDLTDLEVVREQTEKIIKKMDGRFWEAPWAKSASGGFDTNQGRERVNAALLQLYRNGKTNAEWYADIDIIDPSAMP